MLLSVLAVIVGIGCLVWGADRFVIGAAATARNLGVSPLIIGLTIVGIGTSAPEIMVSGIASLEGNAGLAVGNALGSNIANIGLVLGVTALFQPLAVNSITLRREYPLMIGVTILAGVLILDNDLGRLDGGVLAGATLIVMAIMVLVGRRVRGPDPLRDEFDHEIPAAMPAARALGLVVIGLLVLLASSRLVVWGAINVAGFLGVSDLVIGLTVVAVGTSLPELAASLMSVVKNEPDIAIGNVIGSNMFNLLPVLAMPGLLAPGELSPGVLARDYVVVLGLTVALYLAAMKFRGERSISRWEGAALFAAFVAYQSWLYLTSV